MKRLALIMSALAAIAGIAACGSSSGYTATCRLGTATFADSPGTGTVPDTGTYQSGAALVHIQAGGTTVNLGHVQVQLFDVSGQSLGYVYAPQFKDSGNQPMTYLSAGQSVSGATPESRPGARSCKATVS